MSSYNVSRRRSAEGGFVAAGGALWVFHMQGIGSFLLHLTPRFDLLPSSDLHFFDTTEARTPHQSIHSFCILYLRSSVHIIPPSISAPLFANYPASRLLPPCLPLLVVFISYFFVSFCLFYHTMHTFILFITPSYWFCYWLCCCLVLLLIFLFSFFL